MLISRSSSDVNNAMAVPRDARVPHDSERALRVFRDAVEHHGGGLTEIEDLRTPLQQFCREARQERMPPEQVLIRVKRALDGLIAYDDVRLREIESARTRIISLAIETYYSDGARDGP